MTQSDRRPLRIEIVLPTLTVGGMEAMCVGLARGLAARGHEVGIACVETDGALADELRDARVRVTVVPVPGVRTILRAPTLIEHFRTRRVDVVHAHNGVWEKAARAAHHAGVRCVGMTLHGLRHVEPWFVPYLSRLGARRSDWVVAVSEPLREYLVRRVGVPPRKVRVIVNGIDTERYSPVGPIGTLRRELGLSGETPLVGIVARLDPVKHHAFLLDAFSDLVRDGSDAHLALVGDGPLREALAARASAPDLAGRVHLVGARNGLAPVYRELDVFVLSSTSEGTSISVLEAMASGRCIVATGVGGTPALLDQGRCGVLVPSGDRNQLASALRSVLTDRETRRRLGDAARARAVAVYSESAMIDQYEALYATAPAGAHHHSIPEHAACVG